MCDLMDCKDCKHLCKYDATDTEIERMWEELTDVPFIEKKDYSLVLESDWQGWNAGTDRETIWHWFDEHHSKGVVYLLYGLFKYGN